MKSLLRLLAVLIFLPPSASLAIDYAGGAIKSIVVHDPNILTDAEGMTLYIWDGDVPGVSKCRNQCAIPWPPLVAAPSAVAEGDFTLVKGTGSALIWAYKGRPLYHWARDLKPGDTTGDGIAYAWHTVAVDN